MALQEIFSNYLQLLWDSFQYDIDVFSQIWIYAWLLIPAVFYFIFFIIKWIVLTAPIWVPFRMVFGGLRSIFSFKTSKTIGKK
jgi:hypothetical protein